MYNTPTSKLTINGNYFDYLKPGQYDYNIEEIAYSLSKQCRFTGHVKCGGIYSVAQHSVLVSKLLPWNLKLTGLLHDAAETFMGDMNSPLKQMLPEYKKMEKIVENAIFNHFGIQLPLPKIIKRADLAMLAAERRDLQPKTIERWECLEYVLAPKETIKPMKPAVAYEYFMHYYRLYTEQVFGRVYHSDFYQIKHFGNGRILFEGFAESKEDLLQRGLDEDVLLLRADLRDMDLSDINFYNFNFKSCLPFCDA